jgi:hypothetical protein
MITVFPVSIIEAIDARRPFNWLSSVPVVDRYRAHAVAWRMRELSRGRFARRAVRLEPDAQRIADSMLRELAPARRSVRHD